VYELEVGVGRPNTLPTIDSASIGFTRNANVVVHQPQSDEQLRVKQYRNHGKQAFGHPLVDDFRHGLAEKRAVFRRDLNGTREKSKRIIGWSCGQ
jgi:hypothetical protein